MPSQAELRGMIESPREELGVEYKDWLDITSNHARATVARAAIALANHGGGFIVLGFAESEEQLVSQGIPDGLPPVNQDAINAAIRRYATPEFHAEVYRVAHPSTGIEHVVISVPGGHTVPIMSRRDCDGVIAQNRCYIHKPGPRSEEPNSEEEWRAVLNRCVRAQREDMLDAIRAIVTGRIEIAATAPDVQDDLAAFMQSARDRCTELVANLPDEMPARFPHGYYEMAFGFTDATECASLDELQERLAIARRVKLTGWSTFLQLGTPGLAPYPHEDFVEAWVGRPIRGNDQERDPSLCDFWRASRDGKLYTIRGHVEDGLDNRPPHSCFDVTLPVWRVGEGLLFAARLSEAFGASQILCHCRYTGLNGRVLISIPGNRWMFDGGRSETDEITLIGQASPEQVRDNLAEFLLPFLRPLYERFDFFELSAELVGEECQRLQQSRF